MRQEIGPFRGEYRFLSNFAPCEILYEGIIYPTVEHAYVASKTKNRKIRAIVAGIPTAGAAKRFGRGIELRKDWFRVKKVIMVSLLRLKFQQPEFKAKLLATGDARLVEINYWGDQYWGVCDGTGVNMLGTLLMIVRAELGGSDFLF
jgi:ribA/ribD-fused uncharacterized protein